jgi:signal recognition particle receptor subunit beta
MAVFDSEAQKIVIRVVYDGPGLAGKTTNLQQLCEFFTQRRRSELYSGQSLGDRTLYLDWLQLESGLVAGHALRCHLLTVPGQRALRRRRQLLLSMADAVVFVLDSTPSGIEEAEPLWLDLLELRQEAPEPPPLVLQANKQDCPDALTPEAVRARLNVAADIPVTEAQASSGHGVRETVVLAIRQAADLVQARIIEYGTTALEGYYPDGAELEAQIRELEALQPMSPVEVVSRAQIPRLAPAPKAAKPIVVKAPSKTEESAPPLSVTAGGIPPTLLPDPDEAAAEETVRAAAVSGSTSSSPPKIRPAAESGVRASQIEEPESLTAEEESLTAEEESLTAEETAQLVELPPFPDAGVASGFVWPAASGRDILKRVPSVDAVLSSDLVSCMVASDGSGSSDVLLFEAGIWCLKTSLRRRFADLDTGRFRIVELAR